MKNKTEGFNTTYSEKFWIIVGICTLVFLDLYLVLFLKDHALANDHLLLVIDGFIMVTNMVLVFIYAPVFVNKFNNWIDSFNPDNKNKKQNKYIDNTFVY